MIRKRLESQGETLDDKAWQLYVDGRITKQEFIELAGRKAFTLRKKGGSMSTSEWRGAGDTPSALGIPCIAYSPLFLFLFHIQWWTLYLSIGTIVFFAVLAKFGLTSKVLIAKIQHLLRGSTMYARPWWWRNRFQD